MDESSNKSPLYAVGDLVSAVYDMYYHYMSPFYEDASRNPFIGIVVEIDYAMYSEIFGYEIIYLVLCLDGMQRYFAEEEIMKIV